MNYFEQELRRLAKACGEIQNPTFAGRACYGDLGGDNRVKLQFVTQGTHEQYEAVEATVLNRLDGKVDSLLFRFKDVWGKKQDYDRCWGVPHIWTYNNKTEWYGYRPTDADFKQLAAGVGAYLGVFISHDRAPEKTQQESVVEKIRSAKQTPAAPKAKSGRKKTEPEL